MSLIKWTPFFEPFEGMDKFMDGLPSLMGHNQGLVPAIDMYDGGKDLIVETALPGVDPKGIEIDIENGMLSISGSTERKTEVDEKDYYRKEIRSGSFMRQVSLPQGLDGDKAKAAFKDGILKIEIPKLQSEQPKKIKIDVNKE